MAEKTRVAHAAPLHSDKHLNLLEFFSQDLLLSDTKT